MYVAHLGQHRPKLWFTLQIAPNFRQAATLKSLVEDKIAKGQYLVFWLCCGYKYEAFVMKGGCGFAESMFTHRSSLSEEDLNYFYSICCLALVCYGVHPRYSGHARSPIWTPHLCTLGWKCFWDITSKIMVLQRHIQPTSKGGSSYNVGKKLLRMPALGIYHQGFSSLLCSSLK